ncbi:pleckstrin homology domain-containing family G member 3 isoform X2 [Amia ocellicauda]|uniref:pleckstrin homology domain-containing family G member 3 isoform X2 n=1 Tax=Amia ocellicauda TaxID=2972642 RepID=UPI00346436EC
MNLMSRNKERSWGVTLKPSMVGIAGIRNAWEDRRLRNSLNKRISRWFESPRLSTASSISSNERMSTATVSECSTSVSADFSDTDRPVSLVSTLSSGSSRDGHSLYGSTAALTATAPVSHLSEPQHGAGEDIDLELSPTGSPKEQHRALTHTEQAQTEEVHVRLSHPLNNNNNTANRAGQGPLSPFAAKAMAPNPKLSYVDRVVMEIIETERMYVRDLRSIVEDYLAHIIDTGDLPIRPDQVCHLFGNIEDIYEFNSELLQSLDMCENDPVAIARCFVDKSEYFEIYTQYCTNYPNSVAALTDCMRSKTLAKFFRERQASLKRSLPLGSYLLKPVQRILKYHLLLQEIAKHFDPEEEGYEVVEEAIDTMTGVAWYINDMKRKHEHAVRLQEVQSLLINWKGPDLTTYGELVLEGTFRVHRAKNERTLFLFDKMLLITKKRGEHYVYKTHITCSTLMLIESAKDSLSFSVTHYKHPKQPHTVQAKTVEEKRLWTHHIKRLILENHHAIIPQKAKEAILEMDSIYPSKYKYSPERLKKALSCHTDDFPVGERQGRRRSEPAKHIIKSTKALLKHADSEGALQADSGSVQAGASVSSSSLGEPERPSMEEDEERTDCEELGLRKDSLEQLSPSDSEEAGHGLQLSSGAAEEGENEEDEILMGDDQVADFASSMLAAISCWHYRARALLFARFTTDEEGCDIIEENGFKRENQRLSGQEEMLETVEGTSVTQQTAGGEEALQDKATQSENIEQAVEDHPSDGQAAVMSELLCEALAGPESSEPKDTPLETTEEITGESAPSDKAEEAKTLSSGESSEEEEEETSTEHEPKSILPPSVLDQASVIAERFVSNLSRRGSLIAEDIRSLGCPSPRLTSRSSSVMSLEAVEKAQRISNTASEASLNIVVQDSVGHQATSCQDPTILSPGSDNLFEVDRTPFRRRDSTLSKHDRLLINKIKNYYEHAEHQDASFSIKRRESLTYIPAGLVRNSVCRLNSIPKDDPAPVVTLKKAVNSSDYRAVDSGRRPPSWTVFDLPPLEKDFQSKPLDVEIEESLNFPSSMARSHDLDEEFKPSAEMIKVWQEMEKEVSGASRRPQSSEKAPEGNLSRGASPRLSRRGQMSNGSPQTEYNESLMILEEGDLSTITEESSHSSPEKISPTALGHERIGSLSERHKGQEESTGVRVSRAPIPRIIHLRSGIEDEMLLQDVEKVKNKVFQLARQYSQRIKSTRPVVTQRGREGEGQLNKRNLPAVQEEKPEKENRGKPNLTLALNSYDQVTLQEVSPTSQVRSPTLQCTSPARHASCSPARTPSSGVGSPRVLSPSRARSKSPLSPVQAESFNWPDVRELRSKYAHRGPDRTQLKVIPVGRSCSVPEKMVENSVGGPEWRRSSYTSGAPVSLEARGRTVSTSSSEHWGSRSLQRDCGDCLSFPHARVCRAGSLDQRISSLQLSELQNLRNKDLKSTYYVSAEATLPNEQKVIVMEKVPEKELETDAPRAGELALDTDDSFVQIRSPTSREKISIMAVIERCKAYQESEEYRQREEGSKTEHAPRGGKAREPERGALASEVDAEPLRATASAAKKAESSQQSMVKNLRERFLNLSSNI